jgi:molybdenum cofactor biosynthesis protein B
MSTQEHREQARDRKAVCAVLTISDTRTKATDKGGRTIIDALEAAGHTVAAYEIVRDEPAQIEAQLRAWLGVSGGGGGLRLASNEKKFDLICTTGGTGIASRDTTIEVVERLLTKRLDGFGELFRMLSWPEVGAAAMLSRAVGGLSGETLLFTMPGSVNAVGLAMSRLIVPELPHLVWERAR